MAAEVASMSMLLCQCHCSYQGCVKEGPYFVKVQGPTKQVPRAVWLTAAGHPRHSCAAILWAWWCATGRVCAGPAVWPVSCCWCC
jgi:hypothetical protein